MLNERRIFVNPTLIGVKGCWIDNIRLLYLREHIDSYSITQDFNNSTVVLDKYASILIHEIEHSLQDEQMEQFYREQGAYFLESSFFCLRARQILESLNINSDLTQWGRVNDMINRATVTINSFVEAMNIENNIQYWEDIILPILDDLNAIWESIDQWIRNYPIWIAKDNAGKKLEFGIFLNNLNKILENVLESLK